MAGAADLAPFLGCPHHSAPCYHGPADGSPTARATPPMRGEVELMPFFVELFCLLRSLADLAQAVIEACSAWEAEGTPRGTWAGGAAGRREIKEAARAGTQ